MVSNAGTPEGRRPTTYLSRGGVPQFSLSLTLRDNGGNPLVFLSEGAVSAPKTNDVRPRILQIRAREDHAANVQDRGMG